MNASRKCIHWYQNSGTQSHMIRIFASRTRCNLQDGDKFVVRIEGGCKYLGLENLGLKTRQADASSGSTTDFFLSGFNATLTDPASFGSNTSKYIAVQMGELISGKYTVNVDLSERISELYITDGEGMEYAR